MIILRFLSGKGKFFFLIIVLGILNSALYSSILILINDNIRAEKEFTWLNGYEWVAFIMLLVVSFACRRYFQGTLITFANDVLFDFELSILQKIRFSTYETFQKLGVQKVYTAIGDAKVLSQIPRFFVDSTNAMIVILCGLVYLCWTSPVTALITLLVTSVLVIYYFLRNRAIARDLNVLRDLENDYYRYLQDLLHGFKEIKMSMRRNDNLFTRFLRKNRMGAKHLEISTSVRYMNNELFGSYSWYIILGVIVFLLPGIYPVNLAQTTTFVIVILYLMSPISMIMNAFPFLTRANISLDRMENFEKEMNSYLGKSDGYGEMMPEEAITSIRFENITYSYHDERLKRKFTLGPINLTIHRGETVFVVGENGSGKSTFMLLLAGLIQPEGGHINVNECPVLPQNYPSYSDKLSAIFTDAYLFNEHYDDFNINASAGPWREYLEMLRMTDVVRFDDETQRATSKLSKGQQKRLMMMYALMENKQVFLLDEWAAEQDPAFRAYFYRQLLPLLKSMGKTVVAVTHDDHYFEYADRVVTFHDGYIAKDVYARQSTLVATEG